jgi:hypothetical protein
VKALSVPYRGISVVLVGAVTNIFAVEKPFVCTVFSKPDDLTL